MRVRLLIGLVCATGSLCVCAPLASATSTADGGASWVSAPATPPPPSSGPTSPFPIPIGYVGDIEFWQPNRGLLITAGNGVVPEGLFAYNGANWHQLSTVCGGADGRIAWAGTDEFWTIADQRPGQVLPNGGTAALQDVSLCHFANGRVVGSYALPLDQPNSYKPMNAAACTGPSDCWFGGQLDSNGAFHLHWNGTSLAVIDAPQDHEIAAMTVEHGQIFESVQLQPGDAYATEDQTHPPLLHVVASQDTANPFHSLFPDDVQDAGCGQFCPPLPNYGVDSHGLPVAPVTLSGLSLSSDSQAGAADPQLWAAAGPDGFSAPQGQGAAGAVVLRYIDGAWTQVVPNLVSLPGDDAPVGNEGATPSAQSVAAEPAQSAAWLAVTSVSSADGEAHVDRVAVPADGSASVTDHDALGTAQGVGPRGPASAIACPAAHDCWVATTQGWIFHLTDGTQLAQDTDANFQTVITYRPPDGGIPSVLPDEEVTVQPPPPITVTPVVPPKHKVRHHTRRVVTHMSKSRIENRTTLVVSFTLTVRARVQLIARRRGKVVAESKRALLKPGRHTVKLRLDVHHWPTALALHAVVPGSHGSGSSGGSGQAGNGAGSGTIST